MTNSDVIPMPASLYNDLVYGSERLVLELTNLSQTFNAIAQNVPGNPEDPVANSHNFRQVIVALATLQSSVQDLSRAYIQHSNTVLGPGAGGALDNNLTNILTGSGLLSAGRAVTTDVALPAEEAVPEGKKKRKRAKHDPNAPKRALTPYFLFMQTARAEIARELGESAKPKEVADEGTRRWSIMDAEDKHVSGSPRVQLPDLTVSRSGKNRIRRTSLHIVCVWQRTRLGNRSQTWLMHLLLSNKAKSQLRRSSMLWRSKEPRMTKREKKKQKRPRLSL